MIFTRGGVRYMVVLTGALLYERAGRWYVGWHPGLMPSFYREWLIGRLEDVQE